MLCECELSFSRSTRWQVVAPSKGRERKRVGGIGVLRLVATLLAQDDSQNPRLAQDDSQNLVPGVIPTALLPWRWRAASCRGRRAVARSSGSARSLRSESFTSSKDFVPAGIVGVQPDDGIEILNLDRGRSPVRPSSPARPAAPAEAGCLCRPLCDRPSSRDSRLRRSSPPALRTLRNSWSPWPGCSASSACLRGLLQLARASRCRGGIIEMDWIEYDSGVRNLSGFLS